MPVRLIGTPEGQEYEAAVVVKSWFERECGPNDNVTIIPNAQVEGERVNDIDILVIGEFGASFALDREAIPGGLEEAPYQLSNFVLTLEVKTHDPSVIRITEGNKVSVRYHRHWHNATDQSNNQKYALKNWIDRKLQLRAPIISNGIWLRNVTRRDLPIQPDHVLFADSQISDLFRLLDPNIFRRALQRKRKNPIDPVVVSSITGADQSVVKQLSSFFSEDVQLGVLDRRKIEKVCERIITANAPLWTQKLGEQLLIFQGRGGAGKTLQLLSLARHLSQERSESVLLLTYNKALVQDIRRLAFVLGFREPTVAIHTTDKFMLDLCKALDLPMRQDSRGGLDWDYFETQKQEAARQLESLTKEQIRDSLNAYKFPEIFNWDHVLVDEGQDWKPYERDALISIFGTDNLVVADGIDQFVRRTAKCDWRVRTNPSDRQIVTLRKSLRLKSNLCRFALAFAEEMDLSDWKIEPEDELSGGRIEIIPRAFERRDYDRLMQRHTEHGNHPIDSLFCVTGAVSASHRNFPAVLSKDWNKDIWDGTVQTNRRNYPERLTQHRIVRYESSRGLEGWTVVCLDLDNFYQRQLGYGSPDPRDLLSDKQLEAQRYAAQWCLIPFTRAIDTLAIQLDPSSNLGRILMNIAKTHSDFVDVLE